MMARAKPGILALLTAQIRVGVTQFASSPHPFVKDCREGAVVTVEPALRTHASPPCACLP